MLAMDESCIMNYAEAREEMWLSLAARWCAALFLFFFRELLHEHEVLSLFVATVCSI